MLLTTKDGTQIFFKDWGEGQPIVFSHGWPLSADAWDAQMLFFGERGYRVIAHDRRGHGRSAQTWNGNDMNTYADDLAALIDDARPEERDAGRPLDGRRRSRALHRPPRHRARVAKAVLVGAVPPLMLKTAANPGGLPMRGVRRAARRRVRQSLAVLPRAGAAVLRLQPQGREGLAGRCSDSFWRQGMQAGIKAAYDCIKAFSETDFTEDLKKIDVPTLIVHGDDDQIVPIAASAMLSAKLVRNATLKIYKGAPHGLAQTRPEELNADLQAFFSAR